jgi:hypothetical protein
MLAVEQSAARPSADQQQAVALFAINTDVADVELAARSLGTVSWPRSETKPTRARSVPLFSCVIRQYSVRLKCGVIPAHFQKDRPVVELQDAGDWRHATSRHSCR